MGHVTVVFWDQTLFCFNHITSPMLFFAPGQKEVYLFVVGEWAVTRFKFAHNNDVILESDDFIVWEASTKLNESQLTFWL